VPERIVAGLARVSTEKQQQDISIEAQVQQLRDAGCDRVFAERASGYRQGARRPAWDELQAMVAAGQVRKVVACSQSRLSRQGEDLAFLRMCARLGTEVQFLDGTPGNMGDPAGRLMAGVLSSVNEVDSLIKSINTRNGLARRKAAGFYACGRVPFGYLYDGAHVIAHPEQFREARLLWDRLAAMEFNLPGTIRRHQLDWSARGLGRWIRNPILRGIVNGEAGRVPALISSQEVADALRLMDSRRWRGTGTRAPRVIRPFSGMVICQSCGHALHYHMAYRKPRLKCTNLLCQWHGRGLAEWKVRQQVIGAIREGTSLRSLLTAPEAGAPAEDVQARYQLDQLVALQTQGVTGLEDAIDRLRLDLAAPIVASGPDWEGVAVLLGRPGVIEGADDEELRALVLECVDHVLYVGDPDRVEVRLRGSTGSNAE
jgi:DNA invertase Pin-like site-specific DNA recombinase